MLAHLAEDVITGCFDESHLHLLIGWKPFVLPGLYLLYLGVGIFVDEYLLVSHERCLLAFQAVVV